MIYSKHYLKINGKRKTFGMIGETHIYSKKESKFVKDIMRNYEIIGLEGDGLPLTFLEKIMGMSWRYPFKIISNVSNRSFDYKNASKIAKDNNKKVTYLEKAGHIGNLNLLFLSFFGFLCTAILFIAVNIFSRKKLKKILKEAEKESSEEGLIGNLASIDKRNREMSNKIKNVLKRENSLLVIVGELHVKGIIKNLKINNNDYTEIPNVLPPDICPTLL